jgi:hypothetical protein
MRATPYISRIARCVGQDCVEHVAFIVPLLPVPQTGWRLPFSVAVVVAYIVVCVSIATIVNVASITKFEIGAQASVSLYTLLLLTLLSTSLTLTGLARLTGLQGLVGLTTRLATSTA